MYFQLSFNVSRSFHGGCFGFSRNLSPAPHLNTTMDLKTQAFQDFSGNLERANPQSPGKWEQEYPGTPVQRPPGPINSVLGFEREVHDLTCFWVCTAKS